MNQLAIYGWNDKLDQLKQESTYNALPHGRVSVVHRTCYEVISENGQFQCELTGSMMYGRSDFELPCTGDWVIFQPFDENKGIIVDLMSIRRLLYKALMITLMSAGRSALWFRCRRRISMPHGCSTKPI